VTTLILQLHAVKGRGRGATQSLDCELVIRDPHGELIQHFLRMWQVMEGSEFTTNFVLPKPKVP
jgi:hypothetical protein